MEINKKNIWLEESDLTELSKIKKTYPEYSISTSYNTNNYEYLKSLGFQKRTSWESLTPYMIIESGIKVLV